MSKFAPGRSKISKTQMLGLGKLLYKQGTSLKFKKSSREHTYLRAYRVLCREKTLYIENNVDDHFLSFSEEGFINADFNYRP